jgi:hypothetical protein
MNQREKSTGPRRGVRFLALNLDPALDQNAESRSKSKIKSKTALSSSSSFSSSSSIRWPGFEDDDEDEDEWVHGPDACANAKGGFP